MTFVNVIEVNAAQLTAWQHMLFGLVPMAFVITVWLLCWKLNDSGNPDVKFACTAGLYGCYILAASVLFVYITPFSVSNLVESGYITAADASLYTAILISVTFAIWNVIGLIGVICWHYTKKRKELSEMDRMKLEDL